MCYLCVNVDNGCKNVLYTVTYVPTGLISLPDELVLGVGLADLPLLPAFAPVVAFADRGSDGNV